MIFFFQINPYFDKKKQFHLLSTLSPFVVSESQSGKSKSDVDNKSEIISNRKVLRKKRTDKLLFEIKARKDPKSFEKTAGENDEKILYRDDSVNHNMKEANAVIFSGNNNGEVDILGSPGSSSEHLTEQGYSLQKKTSKAKFIRKPDFCYYCETMVLNFSRHITRNHSTEHEVQKILSKPSKSLERKQLFTLLRKQGNYLYNCVETVKPMRKSYIPDTACLPCTNCLGFYSSKQLSRHRKSCSGISQKGNARSEGQNKLISGLRVDEQLKTNVFPRMRADKVSLVAKKDMLICAFGSRYMKLHRENHFINVTSRKMRELAKILMEVKKLNPTIHNMFEALKPQHFDLFVAATKIVANFDENTDSFDAPTFAMNISTSIKQCCDIALNFALKRKSHYANVESAEAETDIKTLIHLFNSNWRFEISNLASKNLNLRKWNKITVVPLASDLKKLKEYLIETANESISKLSNNKNDKQSYSVLTETVYCRVLLLNRKRPGELQRMLLDTYFKSDKTPKCYEEFSNVITPTEKILLKSLKRVVIRGKRGRGVPVLFSIDVQEHINLLLRMRKDFVAENNPYLFALPNTTKTIYGYKVLQKYTRACGAQNPNAITSTRLRKHLATLTQLFNMNESEIEQLASFMGHTLGVHKSSYRLPDDIYQTAKISKLLILMEDGRSSNFKGKTLDEIEIDLDENLLNSEREDNPEDEIDDLLDDYVEEKNHNNIPTARDTQEENEVLGQQKSKKQRILVKWTDEQKSVVKKFFNEQIKNHKAPKRHECEKLIEQHKDVFYNKNWLKIKVYIQNQYQKSKRKN